MAPTYDAWNGALIEYATAGIRRGSPIYLSIDERALAVTWRRFLTQPPADAAAVRREFAGAVLARCSSPHHPGMDFDTVLGRDGGGRPRCVGFLAAMVLAAHDMEDADDASELNYYYRLRRVFHPERVEHGQPDWVYDRYKCRIDEAMWADWNLWLAEQGWEATASQGGHNKRYINYPISQSLLRNGDRERLVRVYREHLDASQQSWDRDILGAHLPELAEHASSARLRSLLYDRDTDPSRYEAVADAAFEVYGALDWSSGEAAAHSPSRLEAGLFRTEDRRGATKYALYPRLPQRWRPGASLHVREAVDAPPAPLLPDAHHAGRFLPLRQPLRGFGERRLPVTADDGEEGMELVLPRRDFWVLVADPDDEYSDALATWGLPALGEHFLLLCRPQHEAQLRMLRDLGLLGWSGDPVDLAADDPPWREYHGCQVLRPRWDHVVPRRESKALVETLRPRAARLTVSLEGGLSVPGQSVWLQGYPPKMRVRAVDRSFRWEIRRRGSAEPVHPETGGLTHELIDLPDLPPGEYDIGVRTEGGGLTGRRVLRLAPWDDLAAAQPAASYAVEGDRLHFVLRGADLLPREI